jgi:hypothetical protein
MPADLQSELTYEAVVFVSDIHRIFISINFDHEHVAGII